MVGLSIEHHRRLNSWRCDPCLYDEMRGWYAGDVVALQQIDVYDPKSPYLEKLVEHRKALHEGDEEKVAELEQWFDEHYPDI